MKKSATLAAALVLCASQAWAYDNLQAGYSVQDKDPFYKMASSKIYAYSDFNAKSMDKLEKMSGGSIHTVNYYTAEEMAQILGENFSTAYFERQYEQIALLQRSQLDVRTVPSPLLDMERYAAHENKNHVLLQQQLFKEQLQKIKPVIKTSVSNGRKIITLSYLYKQMKTLIAVDCSLLSANDRLYMLTTVTVDEKAFKDKEDTETAVMEEAAAAEENGKHQEEIIIDDDKTPFDKALAKLAQLENVNAADIDAKITKGFIKAHNKFLKGFNTVKPAAAEQPVSFTDDTAGKTMALPPDWFYGQIHFKEKEGSGSFTMAASLPTMQKIASELDYVGIFNILGSGLAYRQAATADDEDYAADVIIQSEEEQMAYEAEKAAYEEKLQAKVMEETRKALRSFDGMLFICSFKLTKDEFKEILAMPRINKLETEMTIQTGLQRLKKYQSDFFTLQEYSYDLNFTKEQALINIHTKVNLLNEFNFSNLLRLTSLPNDVGSMLFYVRKSEEAPNEQLTKGINKWQF